MKRGFTLIELLIVVAIIAILAAIAVPNFLEAQTRSKVSRLKADMRTLATAIESYTVDYNHPPPESGQGTNDGAFAPLTIDGRPNQTGTLTPAITTPVSYLTNFLLRDVFFTSDSLARPDVALFTYQAYAWRWPKHGTPKGNDQPIQYNEGSHLNGSQFQDIYGSYRIISVGPDKRWGNSYTQGGTSGLFSPCSLGRPYDPTNGTVSLGSITRSQKETEQKRWIEVPNT